VASALGSSAEGPRSVVIPLVGSGADQSGLGLGRHEYFHLCQDLPRTRYAQCSHQAKKSSKTFTTPGTVRTVLSTYGATLLGPDELTARKSGLR
jgi:hypothetical protein